MDEADVTLALQQPWVAIDNDSEGTAATGLLGQEHPHPRAYATFPRILRKYVREEHRLTLQDAIRKFSALPAQRLGLTDRGVLKEGMWADSMSSTLRRFAMWRLLRNQSVVGRHAIRARERCAGDCRREGDQPVAWKVLRGPGYQQ